MPDFTTVASATGKVSNAADFLADRFDAAGGVAGIQINAGDNDWSIALWANTDTFGTYNLKHRVMVMYGNPGSATIDQFNWLIGQDDTIVDTFAVSSCVGTSEEKAIFQGLGNLSIGTWYFIYAQYDSATNKVGISINDEPLEEITVSGTPNDIPVVGRGLRIGCVTTSFRPYQGLLDEIAVWNRTLTAAERSALYNSGSGIPYTNI